MKNILGLIFFIIHIQIGLSQISDIKIYDEVLNNLMYNTTLLLEENELEEKYYFEIYEISKEEHKKRYNTYLESKKRILYLDKGFAKYLLTFKKEKRKTPSSWIKTVNPIRSDTYAFYTKSQEALILLDFYLKGVHGRVIAPKYLDKLTFKKYKKFIKKNENLDLKDLRIKYVKWLECNISQ